MPPARRACSKPAHHSSTFTQKQLTWIPYAEWANRGEGEMQVWITEA
ncbi:hypothetical protein ACP8Y2_09620 [Herpetosiphon llansteffanensis]